MSLHEIDLAQKISDKILCVKGDTIFGYGEPEAIFKEDFIQKLYEIDNGHLIRCSEVWSLQRRRERQKYL